MEFENILFGSNVSEFITPVIEACKILEPDTVNEEHIIETINYLLGSYVHGDVDCILTSREIVKEYCMDWEYDINKAILCTKANCSTQEIWEVLSLNHVCSLTSWLLENYYCDAFEDMEAWGDLAEWIEENDYNSLLFEENEEQLLEIFTNSRNDKEMLEKLVKLSNSIEVSEN